MDKMKAFTLENNAVLKRGIVLASDNQIHVGTGEPGGRLVRVTVDAGIVEKDMLLSIPSPTKGALLLIKNQSGTGRRGMWAFFVNQKQIKIQTFCPRSDDLMLPENLPCNICQGQWQHRMIYTPEARLIGKFIATGRAKCGPEHLVAVPAGTEFTIRRWGRFDGPDSFNLKVDADGWPAINT